LKRTGGGSDANIFNAAGIPTVIMGVGADRVHTTSERIAIEDMVKGAGIVLDLIKESSAWKSSRKKR
jgi:tripeptide aminopeptidase